VGGLDTKLRSAILISAVLGAVIGFSLACFALASHIQDLRTELSEVKTVVSGLVSTVDEIESRLSDIEAHVENLSSTVDWLAEQLTLLRLAAAANFLYERYDPELQLVSEAPVAAPDVYWLVSDNASSTRLC